MPIITFISFGLIFISEFINHKKEISKQRDHEGASLIHIAENCNIILMLINRYLDNINKKKTVIDKESREFLDKIKELSDEQMKMAMIENDLLSLDKEDFTIEDIKNVYKQNSEVINYDKVVKDYDKHFKNEKKNKKLKTI